MDAFDMERLADPGLHGAAVALPRGLFNHAPQHEVAEIRVNASFARRELKRLRQHVFDDVADRQRGLNLHFGFDLVQSVHRVEGPGLVPTRGMFQQVLDGNPGKPGIAPCSAVRLDVQERKNGSPQGQSTGSSQVPNDRGGERFGVARDSKGAFAPGRPGKRRVTPPIGASVDGFARFKDGQRSGRRAQLAHEMFDRIVKPRRCRNARIGCQWARLLAMRTDGRGQ